MKLWGVELPDQAASPAERAYLDELAHRHPAPVTVEEMWTLIDEAWDASGASTGQLDSAQVRAFYRHPVWLANGIFADVHEDSRRHREALARWVAATGRCDVVDFGGGYGALARRIALQAPQVRVRVVDPYPSALSAAACSGFPQIRYVQLIEPPAEIVIAQDVLEHVADPVALARHLVERTQRNGLLVFANCFEPCIKCHVPATFHLERSFPRLMALLGCRARGTVPGCEHALVFERERARPAPPWRLAIFGGVSRLRHALGSR